MMTKVVFGSFAVAMVADAIMGLFGADPVAYHVIQQWGGR